MRSEMRRLRKEARYWPVVYRIRRRRELRRRAKHDQRAPWRVMVRFHAKNALRLAREYFVLLVAWALLAAALYSEVR